MAEKEKYLDLIQTINGKESFKSGLKSTVEDDVFEKDLDKAWALITDDPKNIALFSAQFLSRHSAMVDYVLRRTFEEFINLKKFNDYLNYIPYQLLRERYLEVQKYVEKDGRLIGLVPSELQEEYVQIPYFAVRDKPFVVSMCSEKALLKYPDISIYALRKNKEIYISIPVSVRTKFNLKQYVN